MSDGHIDVTAEVDQLSTAFRDLTPAQAFALIGAMACHIHATVQPLTEIEVSNGPLSRTLAGLGAKVDLLASWIGLAAEHQDNDPDIHHIIDELSRITDRVRAKSSPS